MSDASRRPQHTPGPWEVDDFTDCQLITKDVPPAIGQPIAIGRTYGENQIANARLIAAAPELLAFVQAYAERDPVFAKGQEKDVIKQARALVAKAEGRA